MARMSAEARSAAAHKAGGKPPPPPPGFAEAESWIWQKIVRQKPIGWFDEGSLPILALYCRTLVLADRTASKLMSLEPDDPLGMELAKQLVRLGSSVTTMATKLRLSVQGSIDRRSGILAETNNTVEVADNLLGGAAVWGENQAVN